MKIVKELSSISLPITEAEYRQRPEFSYSTLSTYEREGFNRLDHLFDRKESPALLEGSMVDCLITGSEEEFNSLYCVADFPSIGDKEQQIANSLYAKYHTYYSSLIEMPKEAVLLAINEAEWQKNWRDDTRVRVFLERAAIYYALKVKAGNKIVVDRKTYDRVIAMVRALKESPATCQYFADNDELSPIRRYYQLKFAARFDGVGYRCMMDLAYVNYEKKEIIPCDLKTSGHTEWDFQDSFIQWNYLIQSRLYWRILKANMMKDPYFKDFTLRDYRFIVVNKFTLTPLVWEFPLTQTRGTLIDANGKEYRDPFVIGKELKGYLDCKPKVPNGINLNDVNIIDCLKLKGE